MTIEEVMSMALKLTQAQMRVSRYDADGAEVMEAENNLRAAILALLDAEAENLGYELVEMVANDASAITFQTMGQYRTALLESMAAAIRARIAARKGGAKP